MKNHLYLCILLGVLLALTPQVGLAQYSTINTSTAVATVSQDRDGNGWANIGDWLHFEVVVTSAKVGSGVGDTTTAVEILIPGFLNLAAGTYSTMTTTAVLTPGTRQYNVLYTYDISSLAAASFANGLNGVSSTSPNITIRVTEAISGGSSTVTSTLGGIPLQNASNGIDNVRPSVNTAPTTKTVSLVEQAGVAGIAGIGDNLAFTVSEAGTDATLSKVLVFFNNSAGLLQTTDFNNSVLSSVVVPLGNVGYDGSAYYSSSFGPPYSTSYLALTKSGGNWTGSVTLVSGSLDLGNSSNNALGMLIGFVDQANNVAASLFFLDNLPNKIDNDINDNFYTGGTNPNTGNPYAISDSVINVTVTITDNTKDGIDVGGNGTAIIIGTPIQVQFAEPVLAFDQVTAFTINMTPFGGTTVSPSPSGGVGSLVWTTTQTTSQTSTDAVLQAIRTRVTLTDKAGNAVSGYSRFVDGGTNNRTVDLTKPSNGSLAIALSLLQESTIPNSIVNPNEQLRVTVTGLNNDVQGYRILANNRNLGNGIVYGTQLSAVARDLNAGTFSTAGDIGGATGAGGLQSVAGTGSAVGRITVDQYSPSSSPAGLNIPASAAPGRVSFFIRDEAGNEDTVSATIPVAVDNILPVQPQSATLTLVDVNGNGRANIGDSLRITISGSGPDSVIAAVYARIPSPLYGGIGQQNYSNIDRFGTALGDDDGTGGRPDYLKLTKVGNNFVLTFPIIDDPNAEFTGTTAAGGTLTLGYHVIDKSGDNILGGSLAAGNLLYTSTLTQNFDNQIPLATTIQSNTQLSVASTPGAYGNNYVVSGTQLLIQELSVPADVDSVFADLTAFGLTANEFLPKLGTTSSKTFTVTSSALDVDSRSDSAKIKILMKDQASNSRTVTATTYAVSTNGGNPLIRWIDRQSPVAITPSNVTLIHTDDNLNGTVDPSDHNGIINSGERIRIIIDVSGQPDFSQDIYSSSGALLLDLSAFGLSANLSVSGGTAAPAPGSNGSGYDAANKKFIIDQQVGTTGLELAAGSNAIIIKNVEDNAGAQTNPSTLVGLFTNVPVAQRIDALPPSVSVPANSFVFSSSSDINGDGIAAVGDGVQINVDVMGADSVFADLRFIGRGITPMAKGVGTSYSIATVTVLSANDPQFATDDAQGTTAIPIIARDNAGNLTFTTTGTMNVDNLPLSSPILSAAPTTAGRIALRMEDGPNVIERRTYPSASQTFTSDITGGTVPGTTQYQIFYDSTGTGVFVLAGAVAYVGSPTTYTSQPFSDGRVVTFKVTPYDNAGNVGAQSLVATAVARINPTPAVVYEPPSGTVIGSVTTTTLRAIIDTVRMNLVNGVAFRARAVDIDSMTAGTQPGTWFSLGGATQTADVWSLGVTAGSFTGSPAVGYYYQVVARVTDAAGNVQTDDQALATNGSTFVYADAVAPFVRLIAINDSTFGGVDPTPPPFVDVKARGLTTFKYQVTDNLAINQSLARLQVRMDPTGSSGYSVLIPNQTVADYIAAGYLSVVGSTYALALDMTPYVGNNPIIELRVQDGRDNQTTVTQRFSVADIVPPAFYLREPFPSTSFNASLRIVLTATGVGNSATMSEATIQLATSTAFASPIQIGTVTTTALTTLTIPSNISLTNGTKYYVRAVIRDAAGNVFITDPNPVVYDAMAPNVTVSFPQAVTVSGVPRITATSKVAVTSTSTDIASIQVQSRRIDQDASQFTTGGGLGTVSQTPFEFSFVTTTNYSSYEGYVVLQITGTDNAGNAFPAQFVTVFVDNKQPSYRITAVNGDEELGSFASMAAGDTLTVRLEAIDNDVASGQFFINTYSTPNGNINVAGLVQRAGKVFTLKFPLPSSGANNIINMDPTSGAPPYIAVTLVDSVGNKPGTYVGPLSGGTPNMGSVTVVGNQTPSALFSSIQRGFRLKGTVTLMTKTVAMSDASSKVRFELKRPGGSAFETVTTDAAEPYQVSLNTANYTDGQYLLRAVPIASNNVEWPADTLTVLFDNSNNGTTERATIVNLGGARIGGTSLTFRATSGVDVGAVRFQARFVGGSPVTGWVTLGSTSVRNSDGTFSLSMSASDIAGAYGIGINSLDGDHEFRAIGEDKSGYQYFALNNPTAATQIPFGTGNADDVMEVSTTRATIDITAPNGIFALRGAPLTSAQAQNFNSATQSNFNLQLGTDTISALVTAGVSDFGVAEVSLRRFTDWGPGTGNSYTYYGDQTSEGGEKVVASYSSPTAIRYVLNADNLVRGGLYELKMYLKDNLGNSRTLQTYDFIAGYPQAYVSGYNQEQKILYLIGQGHSASAKVEYSTDNGTTYTELGTVDLNLFGVGYALDAARYGNIGTKGVQLPTGTVLVRVTASELSSGNFSRSRFALLPTIFSLDIAANGAWSPTNVASTGMVLQLNKPFGQLSTIRPEVQPESPSDPVALTIVVDNNPNVTTNTIYTDYFPRDVMSSGLYYSTQALQGIDGSRLGLSSSLSAGLIQNGGRFEVFAANVRSNGNVDMVSQAFSVERITALRGDTVLSSNGKLSISFAPMILSANTGVLIEEDQSKFRSYAANQIDMGQIGSAYWLAGFNGSLRSGFRAAVKVSYPVAEIADANKDGVVDGRDQLLLNVATISSSSFYFTGDIKDKVVDTVNNTVSFTISSLNLDRYTLVLNNAVSAQQGSIVVSDARVGNTRSNNYTTFAGASFTAIVGDNLSGINTSTAMLFVNNVRVALSSTLLAGSSNSYRFTGTLTNLNLVEGQQSGRFVVENNNGNRYDKSFSFYIDQSTPRVVQQTALFGRLKNQAISFVLVDPAGAGVSGSGVDTLTVFVDVYGTKAVKKDSSELAYEIQQFIARMNPSQLAFSSTLDSLKVSFTLVDNLDQANINGYELVVHDGTTSLSLLLNSNIGNGTSTLLAYGTKGVWDLAGNEAFPINFRVAQDATGPTITVLNTKIEQSGIKLGIVDYQSGVDTSTIQMIEIDSETKDSTVSTLGNSSTLTFADSILTYTGAKPGNTLILKVSDAFANQSVFSMFAESDNLVIRDFHIYPNPFNPEARSAIITFSLSRTANVSIEAYDWLGRSAGTVLEQRTFDPGRPGSLIFTGRLPDGTVLANGVYFLKMTAHDGNKEASSIFKAVVAVKR